MTTSATIATRNGELHAATTTTPEDIPAARAAEVREAMAAFLAAVEKIRVHRGRFDQFERAKVPSEFLVELDRIGDVLLSELYEAEHRIGDLTLAGIGTLYPIGGDDRSDFPKAVAMIDGYCFIFTRSCDSFGDPRARYLETWVPPENVWIVA